MCKKEKRPYPDNFTSFNNYLAMPIESGGVDFTPNLAYKFMGIYEKYIIELQAVNHDSPSIKTIDYNKLEMVRPYITIDNMDIWIPKKAV